MRVLAAVLMGLPSLVYEVGLAVKLVAVCYGLVAMLLMVSTPDRLAPPLLLRGTSMSWR